MPQVYAIDGIVPVVDPSAYVHPSAVLIGAVIVAARAYIGPCASLRGDFGRIVVEEARKATTARRFPRARCTRRSSPPSTVFMRR